MSSCRHDFWSCHFCAVARSFSRQFRQMCFDSSDATAARQKTCFRFQARARWVWQWHSGPHRMCRWYSRFFHGQPRTSRIAIPAQPSQLTIRRGKPHNNATAEIRVQTVTWQCLPLDKLNLSIVAETILPPSTGFEPSGQPFHTISHNICLLEQCSQSSACPTPDAPGHPSSHTCLCGFAGHP